MRTAFNIGYGLALGLLIGMWLQLNFSPLKIGVCFEDGSCKQFYSARAVQEWYGEN